MNTSSSRSLVVLSVNLSVTARVEDPGGEVGPLILDVVSLGGFKLHSA